MDPLLDLPGEDSQPLESWSSQVRGDLRHQGGLRQGNEGDTTGHKKIKVYLF